MSQTDIAVSERPLLEDAQRFELADRLEGPLLAKLLARSPLPYGSWLWTVPRFTQPVAGSLSTSVY